MVRTVLLFFIALSLLPPRAVAQANADAAFLFAYRIKPGMDDAFADGYRRHLNWHAQHQDSLPWFAWYVYSGPGMDLFVDGTVGIAAQAMDERVEPAADGRDADTTFAPYGTPAYRSMLRLRRELGTATRLEARRPGKMQVVVRITLEPGGLAAFERAAQKVAATRPALSDYAIYEIVAGGKRPAYMLVRQFDTWAELENGARDPLRLILLSAADAVEQTESEVWVFSPEHSLFPKR